MDSDIDLFLVSPAEVGESESADVSWQEQIEVLGARIRLWTGNACEVLDLTEPELREAVVRDDRLVRDLREDAMALHGQDIRTLLRAREVS